MRTTVGYIRYYPMELVSMVIAVAVLFTGLYSLSPWREVVPESIFGAALFNPPAIVAFGAFYVAVSLAFLIGNIIKNGTMERVGLMGMFVGLLFVTFLRLIVFGFTPATWIFSLALAVILSISYLHSNLANTH